MWNQTKIEKPFGNPKIKWIKLKKRIWFMTTYFSIKVKIKMRKISRILFYGDDSNQRSRVKLWVKKKKNKKKKIARREGVKKELN